jgi:predicted DNA-binding transcriptional regulator YafY
MKQARQALKAVAYLLERGSISYTEIMRVTKYEYENASALGRLIQEVIPTKRMSDRPVVFKLRRVSPTIRATPGGAVALKFAQAAMTYFQGTELYQWWEDLLSDAIGEAPDSTQAIVASLRRSVHFAHGPRTDLATHAETFRLVLDALTQRKLLRFSYKSVRSDVAVVRVVEPWTLVVHDGMTLLIGPERGNRLRKKSWRLEGMTDVSVSDDSFDYPKTETMHDPTKDYSEAFGSWIAYGGEIERVVLEFSDDAAAYARRTKLHAYESKSDTDEGVRVELNLIVTPELEHWVMGFGASCRVIQPTWLDDEIRQRHANAAGSDRNVVALQSDRTPPLHPRWHKTWASGV